MFHEAQMYHYLDVELSDVSCTNAPQYTDLVCQKGLSLNAVPQTAAFEDKELSILTQCHFKVQIHSAIL